MFFDSFKDSTFLLDRFIVMSDVFYNREQLTARQSHTINNLKGKVVKCLLKKAFVMAGLSKSQIDTMNKFIKALLVFISPENEQIARKIHVG